MNGRQVLQWSARILGILVALFIGLFALDAVEEGFIPFLIHVSPALLLLGTVAVAWRWPWVGAVVFVALALLYTATTLERWDWIATIAGPLFVVGVLFFMSWRATRSHGARAIPGTGG